MKYSYTFFITLIAAALFAQTGRITSLEKSLAGKSGLKLVKDYRQLSEWYFEEGWYKRAAERARQAFGEAKKMGWDQEMALSLNREGKALVNISGRGKNNKKRAFKSFMQSNSLTRDKNLRLDNLRNSKPWLPPSAGKKNTRLSCGILPQPAAMGQAKIPPPPSTV